MSGQSRFTGFNYGNLIKQLKLLKIIHKLYRIFKKTAKCRGAAETGPADNPSGNHGA
jgi:hypothetical protein